MAVVVAVAVQGRWGQRISRSVAGTLWSICVLHFDGLDTKVGNWAAAWRWTAPEVGGSVVIAAAGHPDLYLPEYLQLQVTTNDHTSWWCCCCCSRQPTIPAAVMKRQISRIDRPISVPWSSG